MPRDRVIPNAVFPPKPVDTSGQQSPTASQDTAQNIRNTQLMAAGENSLVPILYGGPERMGGLLYTLAIPTSGAYAGYLVFSLLMMDGVAESLTDFQVNNAAVPAGITIVAYNGSQTTVDPALAAAMPGFSETLNGTAYLSVVCAPGSTQGFPGITAMVKGRKVYDPRTTLTVWSDNTALCIRDFLINFCGRVPDDVYASDAAMWCDQILTNGTTSFKRSTITLLIDTNRGVDAWLDVMRQYLPGWLPISEGKVRVVPDRDEPVAHTFTIDNVALKPFPQVSMRGIRDLPARVDVGYTDTTQVPWRTRYASAGSGVARSRIELPGIRSYSQAKRFATERLNHYRIENNEIAFGVFDYGVRILPGDLATITEPAYGWTAEPIRILAVRDLGNGRWTVRARIYRVAAYSDAVVNPTAWLSGALPDPRTVLPVTALVAVEEVFLESSKDDDSLARAYIYQSRLKVTWTPPPAEPYMRDFLVRVREGSNTVHEAFVRFPEISTPIVQQGNTYTVEVYTRNTYGYLSAMSSVSVLALGKLLPPGDVPAITECREIGGDVLVAIEPAVDIDIVRYEWRVGYDSIVTTWDAMEDDPPLDRVDGLRARFFALPVGTHRLAVKAIDSVGNYSVNATYATVTVTSDSEAFIQDLTATALGGALSNAYQFSIPLVEGESKALQPRWVPDGAGTWDATMPNPMSSDATQSVFRRGAAGGYVLWNIHDLGRMMTAVFKWMNPPTILTPTFDSVLRIYDSGMVNMRDITLSSVGGYATQQTGRYVAVYVTTGAGAGTYMQEGWPKIQVSAETSTESGGPITSSASVGTLVELSGKYFVADSVQITPLGTASRTYSVDNVLMHPESGLYFSYDFNGAGNNQALTGFYEPAVGTGFQVATGDILEVEIYIDPSSPTTTNFSPGGDIIIIYEDATNTGGTLVDQNGHSAWAFPLAARPLADGQWYARVMNGLPAGDNGKRISSIRIGGNGDAASGTAKMVYRNIRIRRGGTIVFTAYGTSGAPQAKTAYNSLTNNNRSGPANSFEVYIFTSAGVQVANDFMYSFKGVAG